MRRVGSVDLQSGEVVVDDPLHEAGLRRAAQAYLRADVAELAMTLPTPAPAPSTPSTSRRCRRGWAGTTGTRSTSPRSAASAAAPCGRGSSGWATRAGRSSTTCRSAGRAAWSSTCSSARPASSRSPSGGTPASASSSRDAPSRSTGGPCPTCATRGSRPPACRVLLLAAACADDHGARRRRRARRPRGAHGPAAARRVRHRPPGRADGLPRDAGAARPARGSWRSRTSPVSAPPGPAEPSHRLGVDTRSPR